MSLENPSFENFPAADHPEQEPQEPLPEGAFEHEEVSFENGPEAAESARDAVRKALEKFNWPAGQIEDFSTAVGEQVDGANGSEDITFDIYAGEDEIRVVIPNREDGDVPLVEETQSSTSEAKELRPSAEGKVIDGCDEVGLEDGKIVMVKRRRSDDEEDGGWQRLKPNSVL